jgi:hypothetical protein
MGVALAAAAVQRTVAAVLPGVAVGAVGANGAPLVMAALRIDSDARNRWAARTGAKSEISDLVRLASNGGPPVTAIAVGDAAYEHGSRSGSAGQSTLQVSRRRRAPLFVSGERQREQCGDAEDVQHDQVLVDECGGGRQATVRKR